MSSLHKQLITQTRTHTCFSLFLPVLSLSPPLFLSLSFSQFNETGRGSDCSQAIMLVTDGAVDTYDAIFAKYNWPDRKVVYEKHKRTGLTIIFGLAAIVKRGDPCSCSHHPAVTMMQSFNLLLWGMIRTRELGASDSSPHVVPTHPQQFLQWRLSTWQQVGVCAFTHKSKTQGTSHTTDLKLNYCWWR